MGTPGTLTKDNIGFSMPAHAPLFPNRRTSTRTPPCSSSSTSPTPDSAARMVPAQADLADVPGKPGRAVAGLVFASYPSSDLGPYLEVVQYLTACTRGSRSSSPPTFTSRPTWRWPPAARWGATPRRSPTSGSRATPSFHASLDRPAGQSLVTAELTGLGPARSPSPARVAPEIPLTLRVIPSPTRERPAVALRTAPERLADRRGPGSRTAGNLRRSPARRRPTRSTSPRS